MRRYNGTNATTHNARSYLSGSSGPFTIWLWYHPTAQNVGVTARTIMRTGGSSNGWWLDHINDTVRFQALGYSGTNPAATKTLPDGRRHFVAFRKAAAGASPWELWLDDEKTTISASINFTFGTPTDQRLHIGSNAGLSSWISADIGEVAIWGVRLTDEMMVEGAEGVAADQFPAGLLGYWPLRGNSSPERDYSSAARHLTVVNATAAPHIEVVPSIWPAATKRAFEPAWVVDIQNPAGGDAIRTATRDLYDDVDADVLGAPYPAGVEGDPQITVSLPQATGNPGGIIEPENWSLTLQNGSARFDRSLEWRQKRVRMRLYDRVSHALFTPAAGLITDRDFEVDAVTFQCSGNDPALDTLVPKQVIQLNSSIERGDDPTAKPIDLGLPIPVACGSGGYCAPPYIERDLGDGTHPGGQRFLLSWGTGIGVKGVFFEADADRPGLEEASFFSEVAGATWRAANKFRVAAEAAAERFQVGWLISYSPDGGTTVRFSRVASTAVGTTGTADITLTDSILGTLSLGDPLSDLYCADDFELEDGVWEFDDGLVVTDQTTLLDPAEGDLTPIAQLTTTLRANPAEFAAFFMSDSNQGVGLSVNAEALSEAESDFDDAQLGDAIEHVEGGDRQQRPCRDVVNGAAALRGMQVRLDYDTGEYVFEVDKLPRLTNLLRIGIGENVSNLLALPRESPTSLFQAVSVLKVRYGAGGRVINKGSFTPMDFAYAATANAQPVGKLSTVDLRLTRTHTKAARITYYWAKTLEHSDHRISIVAGREAWRMRPGKLVQAVVSAWSVDDPYRALSVTYGLDQVSTALAGPFDEEIFSTDSGDINAVVQGPDGDGSPDLRPPDGVSGNMIPNSDFSAGTRGELIAPLPFVAHTAYTYLPGWAIEGEVGASPSLIAWYDAIEVSREVQSIGGHVLRVLTDSYTEAGYLYRQIYPLSDTDDDAGAFPVQAGRIYVFSAYLDATIADEVEYAVRFKMSWDPGSVVTLPIKLVPGANPHPQGWRRYYAIGRAPAGATTVLPIIEFTRESTEYFVDAVQLEVLTKLNRLPTVWQRNAVYGLHPSQQRPGDQLVRAPGETQMGTVIAHDVANGGDPVTLSGASTNIVTVQPGDVHFVLGYVTETITGCTGWKLQLDGVDVYGGMGLADGSNITGSHRLFTPPYPILSAKTLVAVPVGGTFTGGKIRCAVHRFTGVAPSS